ncbi:phosphatase PAP2 family protein [Neobacillus sp. K501]
MQKENKQRLSYLFLIISIILAVYTSIKVVAKQTFWVDSKLADLFAMLPDSVNPFFLLLTELGDKKGIGIVAIIFLGWLLLFKRNLLAAAAIALSVALANEVNKLLKELIGRERPDLEHLAHVDSLSFPSGHAMVGLVVYVFIAYLIIEGMKSAKGKRVVVISAAVLMLLIGASRIILQVHYPSDVIGGFAFGYIWVFFSILLYNYFKKFKLSKRG